MYDEEILRALKSFPDRIPDEIPEKLPLLNCFRKKHPREPKALADVEVLLIQHHLAPFVCRLEAMFAEGLKPERTWMVDIPYSTNETVRTEILDRFGIPRTNTSAPFRDPVAPYAVVQLHRVREIVQHLAGSIKGSRLLVVDDGAYFIRALKDLVAQDPEFAKVFRGRTHIVEQTTRGHRYFREPEHAAYRRLAEETLVAPVVSVAKAKTKEEFESPFIGAAAARSLKRALTSEGLDLENLGRVGIVGFGPVGRSVFEALSALGHRGKITVIDKDEQKHQLIRRLGGSPRKALQKRLQRERRYQLLVGCTGYASFGVKDWELLADNAYLVSASSAAVEFNRKQFVDLADLYPDDEIEIIDRDETMKGGIRSPLRIRNTRTDRQVSFLHASFPINFDGRMECLPPWAIQATHNLLYAAGYQALEAQRPGFSDLDEDVDNEINARARRFLPG